MNIKLTDQEENILNIMIVVLKTIYFNKSVKEISETPEAKVAIVGGWARDKLLGSNSRDVDILVHRKIFDTFRKKFEHYLKV